MSNEILYAIKRNPVIVAAAFVAVQNLLDGSPWHAVLSVFIGVIVRQLTAPAFEVEERVAAANIEGYVRGLGNADLSDPSAAPEDGPGDLK